MGWPRAGKMRRKEQMKRAQRPMELSVRLALYMLKNRLKGRTHFPMVTMLEPLEMV